MLSYLCSHSSPVGGRLTVAPPTVTVWVKRHWPTTVCRVLVQVLDELKQRELSNSEKQEKMQVKKKTVDLLPDADSNLLQLQVTPVSHCHCHCTALHCTATVSPLRTWWRPV